MAGLAGRFRRGIRRGSRDGPPVSVSLAGCVTVRRRHRRQRGPIAQAKLAENAVQMQFHRSFRHPKPFAGFLVRETFSDQQHDLALARGQRAMHLRVFGFAIPLTIARRLHDLVRKPLFSIRNLPKARRRATGSSVMQADIENLPVKPGSLSTVVMTEVLEHFPNPADILKVVRRALKPGGRLMGTVPSQSLVWKLRFLSRSCPAEEPFHKNFDRAELARHGFLYTREVKQFFLPMVVHRLARGAWPARAAEAVCRALGLTALAGSPAILRVDRGRARA